MLRNLRSRRRSGYGAYVCAVISALLLLISVSLLYTRLSYSQSHPHSSYLRHDSNSEQSLTDSLLSDSDDSAADDVAKADEDKIDELDIVDEDVTNDEDFDDDDELSDQVRASGFYFDHVSGAIRRAFDNKRSVEDWGDENLGFSVELGLEDQSKTAFGSDDVAVDEEVRRKGSEVMGIEDALLLKVVGRKASPLRQGWGDWFEKKGDFLRRDKMFKSNFEILNPLNNPLLQDPDGVGVTGLTRGDRIVQKWWLSEFKKVPFHVKKPLDDSQSADESNTENLKGNEREIRRAERRTLKENASNVGRIELILDEKVDHAKVKANSEFLNHVYADGKRWGYYPGLHPHLTFSNFMDEFFRKGECDMRVVMVWNSPPWMYSVRHQRGLESLLYHHRDACVVVFSETIELDFFKDSFLKDGYKVAVVMPNLDELLKDTPAHIFSSVWFEWRKTKFYPTHYSELVRLAALYKYGGIYLDSDVIVMNPLSSLNNSVGKEDEISGSLLNGAVMAFRKQSSFLMECLKEFYATYDDTRLRWNGAELLTRVARRSFSSKEDNTSTKQLELKVQPSFIFFPVSSQNITRYFIASKTEIEKAEQNTLFNKIAKESSTFHFWNSITSSLIPEPDSLVTRLIDHHCIRCFDIW